MATIIMAKQNGSSVSVKYGNYSTQLSGTLIGFTQNAIFIQNNRSISIHIMRNNQLVSSGRNIQLSVSDEAKMYGNKLGIKRGAMILLYDETGKPAGQTSAR